MGWGAAAASPAIVGKRSAGERRRLPPMRAKLEVVGAPKGMPGRGRARAREGLPPQPRRGLVTDPLSLIAQLRGHAPHPCGSAHHPQGHAPGADPPFPKHGRSWLLHGFITTNTEGGTGGARPGTRRRSRTRHTAWAAPGSVEVGGVVGVGPVPRGSAHPPVRLTPCPHATAQRSPAPRQGSPSTQSWEEEGAEPNGANGMGGRATAMYRGSDSKGLCSVCTKYTTVVSSTCCF